GQGRGRGKDLACARAQHHQFRLQGQQGREVGRLQGGGRGRGVPVLQQVVRGNGEAAGQHLVVHAGAGGVGPAQDEPVIRAFVAQLHGRLLAPLTRAAARSRALPSTGGTA